MFDDACICLPKTTSKQILGYSNLVASCCNIYISQAMPNQFSASLVGQMSTLSAESKLALPCRLHSATANWTS